MRFSQIAISMVSLVLASQMFGCLSSNASTAPALSSVSVALSSGGNTISSSSSVAAVTLGAAPTLNVLPWNGAQGAYSLIMDDYCGTTTMSLQWADSVAYTRKVNIGFAVIAGECADIDWAFAKVMVAHGSEAVSHSTQHTCPDPAKCQGSTPWTAGSAQLLLETDTSTQMIQANVGVRPTFFAYPFDAATVTTQNELKALNYLGARNYVTRTYAGKGFNALTSFNGMTAEYDARQPAAPDPNAVYQLYGMDAYADSAASKGSWALRETHGVDDGSWGAWTTAEFIAHIDHIAALRDQGKLWIAPPSRVIRYVNLSKKATWAIVPAADAYEVQWNTALDTLTRYAVPLRVQVSGSWKATQAGIDLGATVAAGMTLVSVDPSQGMLRLIPAP